ncbi:MAG TPA: DUF4013 domain-containing protein, partial [Methanomicrobiales archaeon]|nr:DUF4013 domain-containing protein [Methanomicrobiales archaeon]
EYTRETFIGHWGRWLIFILLGLPFALMQFVVDPRKIIEGTTIHWELVPWRTLIAIIIIGIFASIFIAGYVVQIYRGVKPAPAFANWVSLFVEGLKLDIVVFVWFLPGIILGLLALLALVGGVILPGPASRSSYLLPAILIFLVLIIIAMILFVVAALYGTLGAIRFARTGAMTEGWRFSTITAIIRRMGWGNYIIALILLGVASFLFNLVVSIPAIIPYIGWIVPVCLLPLLTVFTARYFMLIYEAGEAPPPAAPAAP